MDQKSGIDVQPFVDVVVKQTFFFCLLYARPAVLDGVGGSRLPVLDDREESGTSFCWFSVRFLLGWGSSFLLDFNCTWLDFLGTGGLGSVDPSRVDLRYRQQQ